MTLDDWNDFMERDNDERERLHREALASYGRWMRERKQRDAEYAACVDAYHASLGRQLPLKAALAA